MPAHDSISDLIQRWQQWRKNGHTATPEELCKDCPELIPEVRIRIEELFLLDDEGEPGLTATSGFESTSHDIQKELTGRIIAGKYKLLSKLGEGGMGAVYASEQQHPVRRIVAIKLIKQGMDSKAVLARFEAERQALAMMDHPNIARMLDGGVTEEGQPYFVMEQVKGLPITRFCDQEKLSLSERLQLFITVCQGVQHAHQKGIIHRDLKPSNILVTFIDSKPVPKVIDFGVAKALHQKLTDMTIYTEAGRMVGTLEYMAPEQADLNNLDVDTRADIYAMGIILYELLTGEVPFTGKQLRLAAYDEMLRMIREIEPPRPSTKLSSSVDLPKLAALRQIDPRQLTSAVSGELDWIVMKCLEKERGRRYETANALSLELMRFLANEPIEARPPSQAYRLRKFMSRNRGQMITIGLVALALIGGIIGTTIGWWEAEQQKALVLQERDEKEREREKASKAATSEQAEKTAREQAQRRLSQSEKSINLLAGILKGINPRKEREGGPTLFQQFRKLAEDAADQLDTDTISDPLAIAELRTILGDTLRELGSRARAIEVLEKARSAFAKELGFAHDNTLQAKHALALAYLNDGKANEAIILLEEVYQHRIARFGPNHSSTLATQANLAEAKRAVGNSSEAIKLFETVVAANKSMLSSGKPDILVSVNLAEAYLDQGHIAKAIQLLEQTLALSNSKLGTEHADTLKTLTKLAEAYQAAGRSAEAIRLFEQVLHNHKATLGADHPTTLTTSNNLAVAYYETGRLEEAIVLLEQIRVAQESKYGKEHTDTLSTLNNLAACYRNCNRLPEAITILEYVAKTQATKLGSAHPSTLTSLNNLAASYRLDNRSPKAIPILEEIRVQQENKFGKKHPNTLTTLNNLALAYLAVNKVPEAIQLFQEVYATRQSTLGEKHPDTITTLNNLALAYQSAKRNDEAIQLFEQVLRLREEVLGKDHHNTLTTASNLARGYQQSGKLEKALGLYEKAATQIAGKHFNHEQGERIITDMIQAYSQAKRYDKAEIWQRKWIEHSSKQKGSLKTSYADDLTLLASLLQHQAKWAEAESTLCESLGIRTRNEPSALSTYKTQSQLGGVLLVNKKYAAAETLLLQSYDGLKVHVKSNSIQDSTSLTEALDRLIQFYTETNKPEEVKKWQAEKSKITTKKD